MLFGILLLSLEFDFSTSVVTTITDANIHQIIPNEKCIILEFYSPRCPHCISLAPIYEKLYLEVNSERSDIIIAKLDGSQNRKATDQYNIDGYPTITAFLPGNSTKYHDTYKGMRTVDEIKNWINELCPSKKVSQLASILPNISALLNTTYNITDAINQVAQFTVIIGSELANLVEEYLSMKASITQLDRRIDTSAKEATYRVSWFMILTLIAIGMVIGYLVGQHRISQRAKYLA